MVNEVEIETYFPNFEKIKCKFSVQYFKNIINSMTIKRQETFLLRVYNFFESVKLHNFFSFLFSQIEYSSYRIRYASRSKNHIVNVYEYQIIIFIRKV